MASQTARGPKRQSAVSLRYGIPQDCRPARRLLQNRVTLRDANERTLVFYLLVTMLRKINLPLCSASLS